MKCHAIDNGNGVWTVDVSGSLSRDDPKRLTEIVTAALAAFARCMVLVGEKNMFNGGASRASLLDGNGSQPNYPGALARALLDIPIPTVAAMAGHAVGGGLMLGLLCEHVVLAEDRLYGANFITLGITPGMGATVLLEEAFGPLLAREMLYTGCLLTGAELRTRGARVPYILPQDDVETHAMALARSLAAVSSTSTRLLRETLASRRRTRIERALVDERRMHEEVFRDPLTLVTISEQLAHD